MKTSYVWYICKFYSSLMGKLKSEKSEARTDGNFIPTVVHLIIAFT